MPLWFEIAVLVLLGAIVFELAEVQSNIANLGTRLETVMLDRIEAAIRDRNKAI